MGGWWVGMVGEVTNQHATLDALLCVGGDFGPSERGRGAETDRKIALFVSFQRCNRTHFGCRLLCTYSRSPRVVGLGGPTPLVGGYNI